MSNLAADLPQTQLVYVADRESDIYDLFVEAQTEKGQRADLLIRAAHDRKLFDGGRLWEQAETSPVLGTVEFDLAKRDQRNKRAHDRKL